MECPRWLVGYLFIFIYFLGCVEAVRYARSRASQNNEEQCRRVPRTKQDRGERVCFPRETRVLSFAGVMTRRRGNQRMMTTRPLDLNLVLVDFHSAGD